MKAAILYLLLICSWFAGGQPVFAGSNTQKISHSVAAKQLQEKDRFIDAEDQNEEDDLNKKVTAAAKWLSNFNSEFLLSGLNGLSNGFPAGSHSYSDRDICITQRVLRI